MQLSQTFTDNSADNGGVISNDGKLIVTGSTFKDNTAPNGGGAISNDGNMTVNTSTFTGNAALNGNGGAIDSEPSVQQSYPGQSQPPEEARTTTLTAANVTVPSAAPEVKADMAQATVSEIPIVDLIGCSFADNSATDGGAIYNNEGYNLTVNTTTFKNNNATDFGGAIDNDGNLIAIESNFTANQAINGGGAISSGE